MYRSNANWCLCILVSWMHSGFKVRAAVQWQEQVTEVSVVSHVLEGAVLVVCVLWGSTEACPQLWWKLQGQSLQPIQAKRSWQRRSPWVNEICPKTHMGRHVRSCLHNHAQLSCLGCPAMSNLKFSFLRLTLNWCAPGKLWSFHTFIQCDSVTLSSDPNPPVFISWTLWSTSS